MSKERLDELKPIIEFQKDNDSYYGRPANITLNYNDIDWLIEQAERVQELEDRHYRQELIDEHIERLEKQNKRYRETFDWIIQNSTDKYAVLASYEALESELK